MKNKYVFLHFPHDTKDDSEDKLTAFWEDLVFAIDRIDCEKDTYIFYGEANKNKFVELLKYIEDYIGQVGTFDIETSLDILLRDCEAEVAQEVSSQNYYGCWNLDKCEIIQIEETFIVAKIMVDYHLKDNETILLDINHSLQLNRDFLPILVDSWKVGEKPQLILLDYCYDFDALNNWLIKKQIPRTYNFGDNRHLENHPQYIRGKSPLLGSQGGKTNAERLLQTAIGDKRVNKDLINYDSDNECFIWFEYQNASPQNEYHGYHLVKPYTHERDTKAEEKISERIKKILAYNASRTSGI